MESSQLGKQTQLLDADQENMAETVPCLPDFYRVNLVWWHTPERLAFEQQEAGLVFQVGLIRCREDQAAARLQDAGELSKGPDLVPDMLNSFLAEDHIGTAGRDRELGLKVCFLALQAVGLEGFRKKVVGRMSAPMCYNSLLDRPAPAGISMTVLPFRSCDKEVSSRSTALCVCRDIHPSVSKNVGLNATPERRAMPTSQHEQSEILTYSSRPG